MVEAYLKLKYNELLTYNYNKYVACATVLLFIHN